MCIRDSLDTVLPEIDASWPEGVEGQAQEETEEPAAAAMYMAQMMAAGLLIVCLLYTSRCV